MRVGRRYYQLCVILVIACAIAVAVYIQSGQPSRKDNRNPKLLDARRGHNNFDTVNSKFLPNNRNVNQNPYSNNNANDGKTETKNKKTGQRPEHSDKSDMLPPVKAGVDLHHADIDQSLDVDVKSGTASREENQAEQVPRENQITGARGGTRTKKRSRKPPPSDSMNEKWVVATTIFSPTEDLKYVSRIQGWKVVVVGDKKTPPDWSYPNCVFLSLEDQNKLGYRVAENFPENNYGRKTIGYLYAIEHGASIIYEFDDDNRPKDNMEGFITTPTTSGLMYNGKKVFNPYRHFGQPTLWPRGYPLSSVGENETFNYILDSWKTPSVQQGVVNGDPDMDAIFRLTRKKTHTRLNVTFDGRAPPVILPKGVFAPYNAQDTLFLYEAFWSLYMPVTVSKRVTDIWRCYWSQRLLWEIGSNLAFFPPNAFQLRIAHSYIKDAGKEKDLYFKTEDLLAYLESWECPPEFSFFQCVRDLSMMMAKKDFWGMQDAEFINKWLDDLIDIGYVEPKRTSSTLSDTKVNSDTHYWPSVQEPPALYTSRTGRELSYKYIDRLLKYCPKLNIELTDARVSNLVTFPHIMLVIVFEDSRYEAIPELEIMYRYRFPHLVYCGSSVTEFMTVAPNPFLTFIEADIGKGELAQRCLMRAMSANYNMEGYLYITSKTVINFWSLYPFPADSVWSSGITMVAKNTYLEKTGQESLAEDEAESKGFQNLKHAAPEMHNTFISTLGSNGQMKAKVFVQVPVIVYIPGRFKDRFLSLMYPFSISGLVSKRAFPLVIAGIVDMQRIVFLTGQTLNPVNQTLYYRFFSRKAVFLHPVSLGNVDGRKFLCEKYLPSSQSQSSGESKRHPPPASN